MPGTTSKPCHNCRRRRLRCDRSWPSCHKCAVSGQDCLGYGKVFTWATQGVDAQGNLKPSTGPNTPAAVETRADGEGGPWPGPGPRADRVADSHIADPGRHGFIISDVHAEPGYFGSGTQSLDGGSGSQTPADGTMSDEPAGESAQLSWSGMTRAALTDPAFQDLDRNSRYYMAHFADRVCQDLVARDAPGNNPFRELIPMANKHPLLLQILIATSAVHWSNLFRPVTTIPTGLTDPGDYLTMLRSKDLVSRQAMVDALTAKQKAMGHLRQVLDTLDPAGSEVALAAMHFFIKFDLIDLEKSDGKSWKAHLEGASNVLALVAPGSLGNSSNRMLRDCVIADCFIYHILGSTLTSGSLAARIARHAFELLPVMKRVEVNSYLSCPPEILHIILVASQLSYDKPLTDWGLTAADEALSLIDEALAFDIDEWASQLQQHSKVTDLESRVHVASAHRSAACLYIIQALPLVRAARTVDSDFLVGDILGHLAEVGEKDPYFKATSWPTFIAGAETRDAEKRTWSLTRLLSIWDICPWGYIFTAIEMLKATWQMQDAKGASYPGGSGGNECVNWLQDLRAVGFDYLIV